MSNNDEHLYSVVQSAIEIASPSQRKEFLDKSCAGKPGLRTRLQAIVKALPEDAAREQNSVRGSEDSVLKSIAPGRAPNVVLDDSLLHEAEPVIQPTSAEIPKTIDSSRYQLQGEVARGGMGVVLKGRDTDLGRNLAIKVLLDDHKENPQVIQRFIEEAQIGGQLQHPGIAPVYELGQFEDRRPFFTMKLVKGETLAYSLGGRRSITQQRSKLLGIFEQVCQTMAYAHSRRVIHRDLKPANIMVGAFGEVQVMDWGLAKVLSDSHSKNAKPAVPDDGKSIIATFRSSGSDAQIPLIGSVGSEATDTQLGSAMGTPAYMPPEQALGDVDHMDRRSDVFGLGAILCEILTGQPPYVADDMHALMRLACRGNIDDCSKRLDSCGADSGLVELTKECLAFEPKDRPSDAGELAQRLTGYLESVESKIKQAEIERAEQSARALEEGKRRRVTMALAASILLFLALAGSGWMLHLNQVADRQATATRQFEDMLNEAKLHAALAETDNLALRKQELELLLQSTAAALSVPLDDLPAELVDSARKIDTDVHMQLDDTNSAIAAQDRERQLAEQLELVRVSHADSGKAVGGPLGATFDVATTSEQYAKVFAEAGFDLAHAGESELVAAIKQSNVKEQLIASLDHWIRTVPKMSGYEAYESLVSIADWKKAAAQARKNQDANPSGGGRYMQLATALILAGEREEYRVLARDMCDRFVTSKNPQHSGNTIKVCLLLPGAIDLDDIPTQAHEKAVDEELVSESELPVTYGTRAMLAYRRGNLERASAFTKLALGADVDWDTTRGKYARQYLLAIRAMLEHDSGEKAKAKRTLDELRTGLVGADLTRYSPILLIHALEVEQHLGVSPSPELARLAKGKIPFDEPPPAIQREKLRRKLISLVGQVDTNAFRKQVRSAILAGSGEELTKLVANEEANQQPPVISAWLGAFLRESKQLDSAIALLTGAQIRYPSDFWINYELATTYTKSARAEQALGFARTAYATRPSSVAAQWSLIEVLVSLKKSDEAEAPLRRMLADDGLSSDAKTKLAGQLMGIGGRTLGKIVMEQVLSLEPDDVRALAILGLFEIMDQEFDAAVKFGKRAAVLEPESPEGYVILGAAHSALEEFEQALPCYERAVELNPTHAPFHVAVGTALAKLERVDDAAASYRRAMALDPEYQPARQALAGLLANKANSSAAESLEALQLDGLSFRSRLNKLQEAVDKDPRDKGSRFSLADIYFKRAKYAEVLEQAEMILRAYPEEAVAYAMRGRVFRKQGKLDESIQEFRKSVELASGNPNHATILYRLGRALEDKAVELIAADPEDTEGLKFHDEAIAVYRQACEIAPGHAARRALMDALEIRGLTEEVDAILDKFAKLSKKDAVRQLVGEAAFWTRDHELFWAHEALDEVLEINPKHPMALILKSDLLVMQRKYREALEGIRQVAELAPSNRMQLTVAALESMTGHFEDAIQRINGILDREPKFPGARATLAHALLEQGKTKQAIAQCRQAIEEDPSDFQAHLGLASCIAEGSLEGSGDARTEQLLSEAQRHAVIGVRGAESSNKVTNESVALAMLGVVHYRQGNWHQAADTLQLAHETAPNQLLYRPEFLAMAYWQIAEQDEARRWLDVANKNYEKHDYLLPSQQRAWNEAKALVRGEN